MSLLFEQPPQAVRSLFLQGLTAVARVLQRHKSDQLMGSAFSSAQTEMPLEIFFLTITALEAGAGLSNAISEGWRVFLKEGPPVRCADILYSREESGLRFLGLSRGPQIDYARSLLENLIQLPEFDCQDFKTRLLRVKPLNLAAIWLASDDSSKDILISLPPAPRYFVPGRRYGSEDFGRLMSDAARSVVPNADIFFAKEELTP